VSSNEISRSAASPSCLDSCVNYLCKRYARFCCCQQWQSLFYSQLVVRRFTLPCSKVCQENITTLLPHHQVKYGYYYIMVSAPRIVGIPTCYGLDSPRIESRWERDYPQPSNPTLVPTQAPIKRAPALFREGKAAGAWR
jgi:hypothetical protein